MKRRLIAMEMLDGDNLGFRVTVQNNGQFAHGHPNAEEVEVVNLMYVWLDGEPDELRCTREVFPSEKAWRERA